jgi:hypothetical protein
LILYSGLIKIFITIRRRKGIRTDVSGDRKAEAEEEGAVVVEVEVVVLKSQSLSDFQTSSFKPKCGCAISP